MDPNETLKELRELAKSIIDGTTCCAEHGEMAGENLAEKFEALDRWLTHRGSLPDEWCW